MKIRIAITTCFAIVCLAALPAANAAAVSVHSPVHGMFFNGEKKIKFSIRNDTGAPLELKIGDKVSTLQEGEVMGLKLPIGTRVLTNTATEHHPVGDLIVQVSNGMYSDSTITIKK